MRAVIQRTAESSVSTGGETLASIGKGLLILLGVAAEDTDEDVAWLVKKIAGMRIFDDEEGVMNLSIVDIDGEALVISQFTLHASTRKGNRPSYMAAARPEVAVQLYEKFVKELQDLLGKKVGTGRFGADMQVSLVNDGPVTIIIDSKDRA